MSFEYFDKVYCIHLPNKNRRAAIDAEFSRVGIKDVTYVYSEKPPNEFSMSNMRRNSQGEMGVNLSQIKAVVQSIADGAERPLFIEDDITFASDATTQLDTALKNLPSDWDLLYLGGHPTGPIFKPQAKLYANGLTKVGKFSFAEAYAFNRNVNKQFFDAWCDEITSNDAMYDFILGRFSKQHNSFCTYPLITEQSVNVSQVSGQEEDKGSIVARAWTHHLGDNNVTARHLDIALRWRKNNPSRWEVLKRRRKTGRMW